MRPTVWRALAVVPVLAALVSCGAATSGSASGTAPRSSSAPSGSGSASATSPPPPTGTRVRVAGTVAAGVEPGCLVLAAGRTLYLLRGGATAGLRAGQRVQVEGVLQPGLRTTCQQGTPLRVERLVGP